MHSFEVHSNESACRKKVCLGLEQVIYMDDKTWENVVKVVATGNRKMKLINVAFVLPNLFSIYITIHICTSKSS